ncbi:MAG: hypothetical protein ACJAXK_000455 [Yoonia sp.]|jgi:hypothetical protein
MMKTTTILFGAIAAMTLTACGNNSFDINDFDVRGGPQTQSPIADAPGGKLPAGDATIGATAVIIDDSMTATSIFES